jgi:hypothetical protein
MSSINLSDKLADLDKLEKRSKRRGDRIESIRDLKKMRDEHSDNNQGDISIPLCQNPIAPTDKATQPVTQDKNASVTQNSSDELAQPEIHDIHFVDRALAELDDLFGVNSGEIIIDSDDEGVVSDSDEEDDDEEEEEEEEEDQVAVATPNHVAVETSNSNEGDYPISYNELVMCPYY